MKHIVRVMQGPTATISVGPGLSFNNVARSTTPDTYTCKVNLQQHRLACILECFLLCRGFLANTACQSPLLRTVCNQISDSLIDPYHRHCYREASPAWVLCNCMPSQLGLHQPSKAWSSKSGCLQGNVIGISAVLVPPANAVARGGKNPLWNPTPAATAAASYITLPVSQLCNLNLQLTAPFVVIMLCTLCLMYLEGPTCYFGLRLLESSFAANALLLFCRRRRMWRSARQRRHRCTCPTRCGPRRRNPSLPTAPRRVHDGTRTKNANDFNGG